MHDLLVIGAGLAGLTAALSAASAGLRVRVIAKGWGATHWHTGAVDMLGYLRGQHEAVVSPLTELAQLPVEHPYRRLGAERIGAALGAFLHWLAESELGYGGAPTGGDNLVLPSPIGAPRPTYLAPQSQRTGDLNRSQAMLIVGFGGLRDFYPQLIAENLRRIGHTARAAFLPLSLITDRRDFNTVQLAEALDRPAVASRLAMALQSLHCDDSERVGLPAILGLHSHRQTWLALQEALAAPVFEIPTLPPSVPGIRLAHALRDHLERIGVRVEIGMEAMGFETEQGRISAVYTATSARPLVHRAANYLLATGGILGGGFNSDHNGRCWEVVFGLPLTVPAERSQWFRHQFLHAGGQPIFAGGVVVNDVWQPMDDQSNVVFTNLWAAGGLLAHTDPLQTRSLEGLAIATGFAAAQAIVNHNS